MLCLSLNSFKVLETHSFPREHIKSILCTALNSVKVLENTYLSSSYFYKNAIYGNCSAVTLVMNINFIF